MAGKNMYPRFDNSEDEDEPMVTVTDLTENGSGKSIVDLGHYGRDKGLLRNHFTRIRQLRRNDRLMNLRRSIRKAIDENVNAETAVRQLNNIKVAEEFKFELSNTLLYCCSDDFYYKLYYGHIGEVLCRNEIHKEHLEKRFVDIYGRSKWPSRNELDSRMQRNVAQFFGHLLLRDAISWRVFEVVKLTEKEYKHPSYLFLRVLFRKLTDLGIEELKERFSDPTMYEYFQSIFPLDSARDTKFAIKFFISVGLEGITDNLRKYLIKRKYVKFAKLKPLRLDSGSSSSESDIGYSDEEDEKKDHEKKCRRNHIQIDGGS